MRLSSPLSAFLDFDIFLELRGKSWIDLVLAFFQTPAIQVRQYLLLEMLIALKYYVDELLEHYEFAEFDLNRLRTQYFLFFGFFQCKFNIGIWQDLNLEAGYHIWEIRLFNINSYSVLRELRIIQNSLIVFVYSLLPSMRRSPRFFVDSLIDLFFPASYRFFSPTFSLFGSTLRTTFPVLIGLMDFLFIVPYIHILLSKSANTLKKGRNMSSPFSFAKAILCGLEAGYINIINPQTVQPQVHLEKYDLTQEQLDVNVLLWSLCIA